VIREWHYDVVVGCVGSWMAFATVDRVTVSSSPTLVLSLPRQHLGRWVRLGGFLCATSAQHVAGGSFSDVVESDTSTHTCNWCPMWAGAIPPYPFTYPPTVLSFSIFYFPFFPFCLLRLFPCFSILSHFTRILPFRFQAGCRRMRLSLALVFVCVDFVLFFCVMV